MIARSESPFAFLEVRFEPVNSSNKLVERYRAFSSGVTSVFAAVVAFILATIGGFLGAVAATYLYDRAQSKGDDLTVGLGGLFGVGAFAFVVVFTWLQKVHHPISSRTPLFAFYFCLVLPGMITIASLSEIDDHYLPLVLSAWLVILVFGLLALFICRRWCQHEEKGF